MARIRNTSIKRNAILEKFRSTHCHPTAEWVYHELKVDYPNLSLGTVYRNISLFRHEGLLISIGTVAGQEHFDAVTTPHPHFICTSCGSIIDVDIKVDEPSLYQQVSCKYGFTVQAHEFTFTGLCKHCLEAAEAFDN